MPNRKRTVFIKLFFSFSLVAGFSSQQAFAQEEKVRLPKEFSVTYSIPVPPPEHPRLFLRSQHIPLLKKNIESPELKNIWQRMLDLSAIEKNFVLEKTPSPETGNFSQEIMKIAEANALVYLFTNDKQKGRKAISIMSAFLNDVVFPEKLDITRKVGETILTGAMVYDWCYNLLQKEEKEVFIQNFKRLAATMEIGFPPVKQGGVVGHGSEAQVMRDLLAAGIATYDEDKEMYTAAAEKFFTEMVPVRNYWYQSDMHHQGDSYGPYRFQWEMFATLIFDRMGFKDIFTKRQALIPYRWVYTRRPDGQLLRDGDSFLAPQTKLGTWWASPFHLLLAGNYYKDPYLKHEFRKQDTLSLGRYKIEDIWHILFVDPAVKPAPAHNLPLTKYFGDPSGTMVARTAWDTGKNAATVVAEMKIGGIWFANHQHLDAGQFQIYHKGALAIDAGIYEGTKGAYGSDHDINFHKRTIAHNTILVHDPQEEFLWHSRKVANDGGQRFPNNGYEPVKAEYLFSKGYRVAHVTAHRIGPDSIQPDFSYIKGDLTNAYTRKVTSFNRSFVFLNLKNDSLPAALVVFDKVTSANPKARKTWLLHSMEEPNIEGSTATIKRTEHGYSGKLINTTLLPSLNNVSIVKVGGPNREFEVNGTNYVQEVRNKANSEEAGAWRIEVSPKTAESTHHFLNVLQVSDSKKETQPLIPHMVETQRQVGVLIGDRMIFFGKEEPALSGKLEITVTGKKGQKIKVLITDLKEGTWTLRKKGTAMVQKQQVSANNGTYYFEETPGSYILQDQ
ncbi:MAG TPA: heparin/heparin-sulfate lyase HepB [Flavisolibacter sp.]|jgi:heparin/heparan-sulfate lyase|nr:heparin/heparin-sulfate lyase HepB [Flavisolibacter sp.]